MIASQDSHRERAEAPPKASIPRLGGISPEKVLPIPHNEDTRTVDGPDGTGLSEEFHISPPGIGRCRSAGQVFPWRSLCRDQTAREDGCPYTGTTLPWQRETLQDRKFLPGLPAETAPNSGPNPQR